MKLRIRIAAVLSLAFVAWQAERGSKITPAFGLGVFMKDFDKIQAPKRGSPGQ
jgi:hypothetical protein